MVISLGSVTLLRDQGEGTQILWPQPPICTTGFPAPPSTNIQGFKVLDVRLHPLLPHRKNPPPGWRGTQGRPPWGQQTGTLTRWKASWECWKVRSMYLRTDKAAPRTMGYSSLEKT